jgi:NitT/TauT family transport system ATP-binding protein
LFEKPRTKDDCVGMVFQQYSSFPWRTVLENVELGLELHGVSYKERRERAYEMLQMVELEKHMNKYAQYPTLSGGQLQRVTIARSLLASPKILLMDEPFGALDVKTRYNMQEKLLNIWKRLSKKEEATTIVMVTHDIPEAVYLSDEIVIMGKAPSRIVEKIKVDLPLDRNRDMKKTPYFMEMVAYIESKMFEMN